jgi:hypothetical protein
MPKSKVYSVPGQAIGFLGDMVDLDCPWKNITLAR